MPSTNAYFLSKLLLLLTFLHPIWATICKMRCAIWLRVRARVGFRSQICKLRTHNLKFLSSFCTLHRQIASNIYKLNKALLVVKTQGNPSYIFPRGQYPKAEDLCPCARLLAAGWLDLHSTVENCISSATRASSLFSATRSKSRLNFCRRTSSCNLASLWTFFTCC